MNEDELEIKREASLVSQLIVLLSKINILISQS